MHHLHTVGSVVHQNRCFIDYSSSTNEHKTKWMACHLVMRVTKEKAHDKMHLAKRHNKARLLNLYGRDTYISRVASEEGRAEEEAS
jgi:hypothetical protein